MPIYEYYCVENHTIYQFYAKTLAQGKMMPACPANPKWALKRVVSQFAFTGRAVEPTAGTNEGTGDPADARLEAAMGSMEKEFDAMDENDPRAMAHMMRRMAELTGEKIDGEMEEVVRKLEEGADPEELEDRLGADEGPAGGDAEDSYGMGGDGGPRGTEAEQKEARMRYKRHRATPHRDPALYDYE